MRSALIACLALSLLGNALLAWLWVGAREGAAVATHEGGHARAAAAACSEGTEVLVQQADKREGEGRDRQAAAAKVALEHERKAQDILITPAAVPGDSCASAQARIDEWLADRVSR